MDDGWSFDFLTSMHGVDSDDSGQEDGSLALAPAPTEAKLLKDMDLSTREESVVYKPNPFIIAKMNAAYRTRVPVQTTKVTRNPSNAAPVQIVKPGQKTLAEGFALQKKKSKPLLPPRPAPLTSRVNPRLAVNSTKEQLSDVLPDSPPRLPISIPVNVISLNIAEPLFHIRSQENQTETSQGAHILMKDLSNLDREPQVTRTRCDYENSQRVARRRDMLPFSSPINPPNRTVRAHQDAVISFSSPVKPPPIRSNQPPAPQRFKKLFPKTRAQVTTQHAFRRDVSMPLLVNPTPMSISKETHCPPERQMRVKDEDLIDNSSLEFGLQYDINKLEPSDEVYLGPYFGKLEDHLVDRYRQEPETVRDENVAIPRPVSEPHTSSFLSQVGSRQDAYRVSGQDPDEEWSTLPSRKKMKINAVPRPTVAKFTKPFRLPGIAPPQKASKPEIPASINGSGSGRKVHLYLPPPPPLPLNKGYQDIVKSDLQTNADSAHRHQHHRKPRLIQPVVKEEETYSASAGAYPSPQQRHYSPHPCSHSGQAKPKGRIEASVSKSKNPAYLVYRPPSPPASDLPTPIEADDETEVHMKVDTKKIREGYLQTRVLAQKRRRALLEVWEILGLQSCGVVCIDEDAALLPGKEIGIVNWTKECLKGGIYC